MSRTAARFTQADIHRAIKAVEQAGADMAVEILRDGTIRIVPARLIHRDGETDEPRTFPAHREIVL